MIAILENNIENPIAHVVLAHGAGADMHHEFMEQMAVLFNQENINVLRFNFPYMDKRITLGKRFPPDRMPKLIACYKEVIFDVAIRNQTTNIPLFIGGKSMGSRVAATLASDKKVMESIQGVFCFGYPFHPVKQPEKLRLEPLQNTGKPILIVQGERDTLGSKDEVKHYDFADLCQCLFLTDGDHSLKPRVKSGFTQLQHMKSAISAVTQFIQEQSLNGTRDPY